LVTFQVQVESCYAVFLVAYYRHMCYLRGIDKPLLQFRHQSMQDVTVDGNKCALPKCLRMSQSLPLAPILSTQMYRLRWIRTAVLPGQGLEVLV